VGCYAWTSSPLRRYVDLVNQWQLVASLQGRRPPFTRTSEGLLTALRAFEITYARYDEHQRAMETYWSLRWLLQESREAVDGSVIRENLVRLAGLPMVIRVGSLPELASGTRVRLAIRQIDLVERSLDVQFREVLPGEAAVLAEAGEIPEEKA
jgi:exoribonuclease II